MLRYPQVPDDVSRLLATDSGLYHKVRAYEGGDLTYIDFFESTFIVPPTA